MTAKHVGESLQFVKTFLVMNTATTADENLGLADVGNSLVGLDGLDELYLKLAGVELGSELSHDTLAASLALHLLHHTGAHG